jgi:hypothetical protein
MLLVALDVLLVLWIEVVGREVVDGGLPLVCAGW